MTLQDLLPDVLGRTEESNPPVFWSLVGEVYVQMIDAMFEAALMTGVVQQTNVLVTLQPGVTYFALQSSSVGYGQGPYGGGGYGGSIGVPKGTIAALRLKAPYAVRKTSLSALDSYFPAWQQAAPSDQIVAWFPLGTSGFGIYPQLADETQVTMDFLLSPCNQYRPYSGSILVPFQIEFSNLISMYAAAMCRAKESGSESEEAEVVFQDFLGKVKDLSLWQTRLDSLTYSSAYGAQSRPSVREVV